MDIAKIVFRVHALLRMVQRDISPADIRKALEHCELIEDYPEDKPYPSSLVLGWLANRPLHIVIAQNIEIRETIVVTVYEPDSSKWDSGFKRRKV